MFSVRYELKGYVLCGLVSVFKDRATGQVVNLRPFTAEAQILFRARPCKIKGGQNGTMTGFP